jgi:hypothetical protein
MGSLNLINLGMFCEEKQGVNTLTASLLKKTRTHESFNICFKRAIEFVLG